MFGRAKDDSLAACTRLLWFIHAALVSSSRTRLIEPSGIFNLQSLSLAPGTWQNKDGHWSRFVEFCSRFQLLPLPCDSNTLVLYTTFLACVKFTSYQGIKNVLSCIRTFHSACGYSIPLRQRTTPGRDSSSLVAASILLQSLSLAPGTWQSKDGHWSRFVEFCSRFKLSPLPCGSNTLVFYTTFLVCVKFTSHHGIKNVLSSIRTFHSACGYSIPFPTEDYSRTRLIEPSGSFISFAITVFGSRNLAE